MDFGCRGNGVRADFRTKRNIRLQPQGKSTHPWLPGRRDVLARGTSGRWVADHGPGRELDGNRELDGSEPEENCVGSWRATNLLNLLLCRPGAPRFSTNRRAGSGFAYWKLMKRGAQRSFRTER